MPIKTERTLCASIALLGLVVGLFALYVLFAARACETSDLENWKNLARTQSGIIQAQRRIIALLAKE